MSQKENLKNTLISDLNDLHVRADVSIEKMADELIDIFENVNGNNHVGVYGKCLVCADCPHNYPLDEGHSRN